MNRVIYTEKRSCQDCYKCIKICPVKSIRIEDFSASIINEDCIFCGKCILACPAKSKRYRDDISKVQLMIEERDDRAVIACLAPAYVADFDDIAPERLLQVLYALGFTGVSETAIGAEAVADAAMQMLDSGQRGPMLSTCCPAVVNYIKIYAPEIEHLLSPLVSPMVAHTRLLRANGYEKARMIFIGPCVAKKQEAGIFNRDVDAVLSFEELLRWMDQAHITFDSVAELELPAGFVIGEAKRGGIFPVDGGMINTMQRDIRATDAAFMAFSGISAVMEICNELKEKLEKGADLTKEPNLFLELTCCEGGCIKGTAISSRSGLAGKRQHLIQSHLAISELGLCENPLPQKEVDLSNDLYHLPYKINCLYDETEINQVLHSMGKWSEKDMLNCSGCGYDSCRAYAIALLEGKAEREMCVSQMRKEAQNKASVLLQKMPYGVVTVDEHLKVIDANKKLIEMAGEEAKELADMLGTLSGVDLRKLLPFHKYFSIVLQNGTDAVDYEIREGDAYYHLSLVSIIKYKVVCGIIQNMNDTEIKQGLMVERVREVIRQNAEAVQRIAFLLGESASFTESTLNSILEKGHAER